MIISREKYNNLNLSNLVDVQRDLINALNKKIDLLEEQNQMLKEMLFGKKDTDDEKVVE